MAALEFTVFARRRWRAEIPRGVAMRSASADDGD